MPKVTKLKREKRNGQSAVQLIIQLALNTFALLVVAYLIPGFVLESLQAAVVASVVLGLVNTFIRPILQFIALPLTILTLGIAAFFVNVIILWYVAKFVPGFEIMNFVDAIVGSILLTLVTWFLHKLAEEN